MAREEPLLAACVGVARAVGFSCFFFRDGVSSSSNARGTEGRSAGFLARRAAMRGSRDPTRRIGGASSYATACREPSGSSRWNGQVPSTASYSVVPKENRSLAGPASLPRARSGER